MIFFSLPREPPRRFVPSATAEWSGCCHGSPRARPHARYERKFVYARLCQMCYGDAEPGQVTPRTTKRSGDGRSTSGGTDRPSLKFGRETSSESRWSVARASKLPVSYRKHGSANGNRTRIKSSDVVRFSPI